MHDKRFDPSQIDRLENPERHTWLPTDEILGAAAIQRGESVADIGAGTGYFAIPIAQIVAPAEVFAIDVAPEMIKHLNQKLARMAIPNISTFQSEASTLPLPDASCDVVFAATVWHEFDDYAPVLREFARVLKPQGRVVILDWSPDATRPPGPPIEHRVPMTTVSAQLADEGWRVQTQHPCGLYTYVVIASR